MREVRGWTDEGGENCDCGLVEVKKEGMCRRIVGSTVDGMPLERASDG